MPHTVPASRETKPETSLCQELYLAWGNRISFRLDDCLGWGYVLIMDILPFSVDYEATLSRRRPGSAGVLPWDFLKEFRTVSSANDDRPHFDGQWPSLPRMFEITAWRYPERPCLTIYEGSQRISLNFRETLGRVRYLAAWFRSQNIQPGDRIAVSGKNSPEWAISYLAALFADAIVVPIDTSLRQDELANLLKVSGSCLLAADRDKIQAFQAAGLTLPSNLRLMVALEPGDNYVYDLINMAHDLPQATPALRQNNDIAAILYTSGTTGNPKGVMLSHANLISDVYLSQYHLTIYPSDVFYALLPIHHSYTMLAVFIISLSVGAEIVFGKKMVISQILSDLKQARVSMFLGVPMLFNRLLAGIMKGVRAKGPLVWGLVRTLMGISGAIKKTFGSNPGKHLFGSLLRQASLDSIRICISGGGPLPPQTFRQFNELGIDFVQGYGLTETSPIITLNPTWRYKESSVGAMLPGVEMKILSPETNGHGEIAIRGPMVMQGYYGSASGGLELEPDGWLHTGDIGWIDNEGYVYLTGRAKNVIVTEGGKNVYPEEIENQFQLYPEIDQVMVRGFLLDPQTHSEGIEALIFPARESFADSTGAVDKSAMMTRLQAIIGEINARLGSHQKINRHSVLDAAMEMTSTKKIRRFTVGNQNNGVAS